MKILIRTLDGCTEVFDEECEVLEMTMSDRKLCVTTSAGTHEFDLRGCPDIILTTDIVTEYFTKKAPALDEEDEDDFSDIEKCVGEPKNGHMKAVPDEFGTNKIALVIVYRDNGWAEIMETIIYKGYDPEKNYLEDIDNKVVELIYQLEKIETEYKPENLEVWVRITSKKYNVLDRELKAEDIDFVNDYLDLWNTILVARDQDV